MKSLWAALCACLMAVPVAGQTDDATLTLEILTYVVEPCYQSSVDARFNAFPELYRAGITKEMSLAATRVLENDRTREFVDYLILVLNGVQQESRMGVYSLAAQICIISTRINVR